VPKPPSTGSSNPVTPTPGTTQASYARKSGHLISTSRVYKPKSTRGGRRPANRNMTLTNNRRPYQSVWSLDLDTSFYLITCDRTRRLSKRKYSDKQCPRFSTTGATSSIRTRRRSECIISDFYSPLQIFLFLNF